MRAIIPLVAATAVYAQILILLNGPAWAADPSAGSQTATGTSSTAEAGQSRSLIRHYVFEDLAAPPSEVRNLTGPAGVLSFRRAANSAAKPLNLVEGRRPQKKAVRLDRDALSAEAFPLTHRAFAVTAWLRIAGPGSVRGDSVPQGGTLLSLGGGYWDGWRLTYRVPDQTLGFEIGRPKPQSAIALQAAPLTPRRWHHVAACWDGQRMELYLDGMLTSAADYAGAYTPPADARFRMGFAGYGWGSVEMDVAEVSIYDRALSRTEVLLESLADARPSPRVLRQLESAADALQRKDPITAAETIQSVMNQADSSALVRAWAASTLWAMSRKGGLGLTRSTCEVLLASPDLAPGEQVELRLNLARLCREAGDYAAACSQYQAVLARGTFATRPLLDIQLQLGHTAFAARDFAGARTAYSKVVAQADAPAHFRSHAALQMAQSHGAEKRFAEARSAFERIEGSSEFAAHHRLEAQERRRELERREQGLPPRDPAWSRIAIPKSPAPALEFFVAPEGADRHPGTREKPFASLEAARDAIRTLKNKGALPPGGVAVTLKAGAYQRQATFALTAADSGFEASPIVYRAESKGAARLTGGVRLDGFQPVADSRILARLPAQAHGNVLRSDLKARGISDFGQVQPRGYGFAAPPALELFFDGKAMPLARWPNQGFVRTGKVIDAAPKSSGRGPAFAFDDTRLDRWTLAKDALVYGYFTHLWADTALTVASFDSTPHQVRLTSASRQEIKPDMPFYVFNLIDELDAPGEWYLDRSAGVLYFWPPSDPANASIELSVLATPMVRLDNVSHVTLDGLMFELGRSDGVVVKGGNRCLIAGCTLRKLGGEGAVLDGGTYHGVLGCDLHTLGRGGTRVIGGNRATLTPGGHFVENCHVHDFSRIDRTYTPAVFLDGVANRIAHNLFHDSPGHAIRLEGNDHVVEFNDVHHVLLETDDQGGLDMWGNPTYRGNVLRHNFWHDIGSGGVPCGQAGIRLDDGISGVLVYGNIFQRCAHMLFGGVQIHGGKENIVDNNLFVDCRYAVSFSLWSEAYWKTFIGNSVRGAFGSALVTNSLYLQRYPTLAQVNSNLFVSSVWRNALLRCGDLMTRDRGIQDVMDNPVLTRDPGFVDSTKGDFRLSGNAEALMALGFRPIPFEEIGLYESEHRASWPVKKLLGR